MSLLKCSLMLMAAIAAGVAEPQGPGNQYLPPDTKGYNYNAPTVPFPPPKPQGPPGTTQPPRGPPIRPPPPPQRPGNPPPTNGQPPYRPPPPPPNGDKPRPPPPPVYGRPPAPGPGEPGHVHIPGMPYDFNYAVKDATYGTDYSHNAASDGDVVKGEWRVQLPDGRLQIVRYTADWATGFHADVSYEGEATYPQATPQGAYGPPRNIGSGGGYSGPPPPPPANGGGNGNGAKRPNGNGNRGGGGGGY